MQVRDAKVSAGTGRSAGIFRQYLAVLALHTAVFLGLFRTPLFADGLLFYRGLGLLAVSLVLCLVLIALARGSFRNLRPETAFSALVLSGSLHLAFFVVVPVTVDRSVSTRMLEMLARSGAAGMSRAELQARFSEEYLDRDDALGRRLREQVISNNLREQDGRYVVTEQGSLFLRFSRLAFRVYQ